MGALPGSELGPWIRLQEFQVERKFGLIVSLDHSEQVLNRCLDVFVDLSVVLKTGQNRH